MRIVWMSKFAGKAERAMQICIVLVTLVFFISGMVYVYLGRRTVSHQDFWSIYDYCLNHTWLESALRKYNNHSHFFPSFFWLADLRFFHGNQTLLFLLGLPLHILAVTLLLVPTWRDSTMRLTSRLMATLVLIVASFSMGLEEITHSGGFTCCYSLVLIGGALAFASLSEMRAGSPNFWTATVLVVSAGFVASFSFGSGLMLWPTFLFLGWCLRLPWRSIAVLLVAGIAANTILMLLPPHFVSRSPIFPSSPLTVALPRLCTMLGTPVFLAQSAWSFGKSGASTPASSNFSLWYGGAGLIIAAAMTVTKLIRRDLGKSNLELTGMALLIFDLLATTLVVITRANWFDMSPKQIAASRYMFWGMLFWAGLLMVVIQCADAKRWSRWLVFVVVLAIPVFMFPRHHRDAGVSRKARWQAECGATGLINGVRDPETIAMVNQFTTRVYHLAPQLRARRLDMFADGLQDWIGLSESKLFQHPRKSEGFQGQSRIDALVECDDGQTAARVVGHIDGHAKSVPKVMVVLDSTGIIRGIARSSQISPFVNSVIYHHHFMPNTFLGYIRDYDQREEYAIRGVDNGILSEERISVPTAVASIERH